ncbi:MAG: ppnK [Ilumatobacteraceae bacterium]|nr:ppnK [Ilumatobacteraceae bacterium]
MSSVFIVAHHERTEAGALALAATDWLRAHGHDAWMSTADATALSLADLGSDQSPGEADLALCLGGDGTMLRTIKSLDGAPVPVIGVNVGVLGYLTEIEPPALIPALERWFDHDIAPGDQSWHIEERMMLQITVDRVGVDDPAETWRAMNEVVLEKGESGHTVHLLVSIDGALFTSYAADGLIVATPTGSTAYSLSARGPVVSPQHRAMLLTPVSPHMLFDRSLVLDPGEPIVIEVTGYRSVEVSVDGQRVASLSEGDTLTCVPAVQTARFVRFGPRRFHQILKAKFGLTDR